LGGPGGCAVVSRGWPRLSPRLLLRPSAAVLIVLVVAGVWALTLAPWGLVHSRTVFRGSFSTQVGSVSAVLDLEHRPTTLSARLVPVANTTNDRTVADLDWGIDSASGGGVGGRGRLTYPDAPAKIYRLQVPADGAGPYRFAVGAESNAPCIIQVALGQSRDYLGNVSLAWVLFLGGLAYITCTLVLSGGWASRPVIISPKHEHY